jgi:hypothetical protein
VSNEAADEAGGEAARRAVIGAELARLEESAMYSAQGQFEQAKMWRAVNLSLGVPAAVLAAVAGVTSLADLSGGVVSGLLALASAALGGLLTVVNPSQRSGTACAAANVYLEVQTAARQQRRLDLPYRAASESRAALTELSARYHEQNRAADPVAGRAYRRARRNIESGGQTFSQDYARDHE